MQWLSNRVFRLTLWSNNSFALNHQNDLNIMFFISDNHFAHLFLGVDEKSEKGYHNGWTLIEELENIANRTLRSRLECAKECWPLSRCRGFLFTPADICQLAIVN